ncbi:hypothetical protein PUN28_003836 [Cardiocondyla obscurior]|uniref:Uncharacterized protein n=1 Tax=Cardiocondyla obscurior TaxID=286306 RepID=A0AAW2GPB3_9HYME
MYFVFNSINEIGTVEQRSSAARRGAWRNIVQHRDLFFVRSSCFLSFAIQSLLNLFARFTLAAKENERNGAGQVPAGGCSSPLRAASPENSKKVRRGRLNSRRKLRRAFSTLRLVPRRQIGGRIDRGSPSQRRGRNNISPGAVARRENRSCRDGESVRNGTERPGPARPGPAPLIPPADQKGKKRNDEVPTHAARYLTGQSISLSREIIPGGDGGVNHTFRPDNYSLPPSP